jgi:hypothetical protein
MACSEPDTDLISNSHGRAADKEEIQGVVQVSRRFFERCAAKRQDEYAHVRWRGRGKGGGLPDDPSHVLEIAYLDAFLQPSQQSKNGENGSFALVLTSGGTNAPS